jgi:two-component system, response regulator PdtaR
MDAQYCASGVQTSGSGFSQSSSDPQLLKDGRPLTVLIVEDDDLVAEILRDAVEDHGGRVAGIAAEPAMAFGLVVENKPDVVVMDVRLKDGHDGLHAADAMRHLYQTPIVFCTGYSDIRTVERIRQFGGAQCLFKPIRPGELAHAILGACGL